MIRQTCTAAHEERLRGLVIFIDEIQAADRAGLRTLAYAWQHLQAEAQDVPAATFSERFRYRPLQRLSRAASLSALVTPAASLGVPWQADTLETVVDRAEGYPYTLQLYGEALWVAAGNPDAGAHLGESHLALAQREVDLDLLGLFRPRWAKSTPLERTVMTAMAQLGDAPSSSPCPASPVFIRQQHPPEPRSDPALR